MAVAIDPETIPTELQALKQWCLYKIELVDDKRTKVPYQVFGQRADSTDPETWTSFSTALAAYQDVEAFDGLCFMLAEENGIVFIDLDDSIEPDGTIKAWAQEIVNKFNSYTERSQSGKGLHILIRGVKPGPRCRKAKYPHGIEIYSHSRQCCLTGDVV